MYYEVYIDSLFLVNFVMNLYLLALINVSYKRTATRWRLILGACFGAAIYCLMLVIPYIPVWVKLILGLGIAGLGMIKITFGIHRLRAIVRIYGMLLGYSFLMGGILLFIRRLPFIREKGMTIIWVMGLGGLSYLAVSGWIERKQRRDKIPFCQVSLQNGNDHLKTTALIDTGNSLREPISGKPVSVTGQETVLALFGGILPELYRAIPYRSVGNKKGIMRGYEVPLMVIETEDMVKQCRNVYLGISEEGISEGNQYQIILHPKLLENENSVDQEEKV